MWGIADLFAGNDDVPNAAGSTDDADMDMMNGECNPDNQDVALDVDGQTVFIDKHLLDLHNASSLEAIAQCYPGTDFGDMLSHMSTTLSGSDLPGMEIIKDSVDDVCSFYHVDPVNVCFTPDGTGMHWGGFSPGPEDNWMGANPYQLKDETLEFATPGHESDYVNISFAHEMGHYCVDQLGMNSQLPRIANEAVADYLAGIYAGSKGLDPDGFSRFLSSLPEEGQFGPDGEKWYPGGNERAELFREGYEAAQNYTWQAFQSVVDDARFDLHGTILNVAGRYC